MRIRCLLLPIAMLCTACDSPEERSEAHAGGEAPAPIRAMGNEPFWNVEISEEGGLVYTRLGRSPIAFPYVAPRISTGDPVSYAYGPIQDASEAHTIQVSILDEPCQDTMADQIHPMTSTVTIDGEELRGCARPLSASPID